MEMYQHTINEKSLEWLTFYPNIGVPQFTPINYYLNYCLKTFHEFNVLGSLIIAEILPLFEDFNIPLVGIDYMLFVNPNDNIANGFDIEKYKQILTTDPYLLRQKQYWQECVEAFNWFRNKLMLSLIDIDKMIQKEIVERYNYDFDKNDLEAYYKFRKFLSETQSNREDGERQRFEKKSDVTLEERLLEYKINRER